MHERMEQGLVEQFVAQADDEGLGEGVLRRPPDWLKMKNPDAPAVTRGAGEREC
jgi:hypothetical protein